jgi:hypothetical protein
MAQVVDAVLGTSSSVLPEPSTTVVDASGTEHTPNGVEGEEGGAATVGGETSEKGADDVKTIYPSLDEPRPLTGASGSGGN